ncbi:MAG: hypothetical protein V4739_11695 [Pseudomonadota bacterium]
MTISEGSVHFDLSGLSDARDKNRDTLQGQGVYADVALYGTLFNEQFSAKNVNIVTVQQYEEGLVEVFGSVDAYEGLAVDFNGLGLRAEFKNHQYELTAISTVVPPVGSTAPLRAVADLQIDGLFGTVYNDTITLDVDAKLKEVHGGGGNDSIDVNVANIGVYLAQGDSLVKLRSGTSGATLVLREGNEAVIETVTGTTSAAVNVTIFGGLLLDTYVDASISTELLNVNAQSGKSTIHLGFGASEIRVSDSASMVKVIDSQSGSTAALKFLLQDSDGFNINNFVTTDGQIGQFLHTVENGTNVYTTNWYNSYGDFTVLQFQGDDIANVSLEVAGISGSYLLSNLIATPMPEPAPAPV